MLYVGRNDERSASVRRDASDATWSKGTNGLQQHDRVARRSSMPRRPARPVSCVYSPGVRNSWRSPVNFESFSITTDRAGMLMPSASVSVANTTFTSPAANASSTASFIGGTMPGVVRGEPGLEPGEPLVVAEHVEVVVGERRGRAPRRCARISRALVGRR